MSIVLYGSRSTASLVVHWLLIELGLEHELRQLDFERREQASPGYLAINPAGRVPALLLDGQVLTESAAIAMHLADLHPQAGLAPPPGTPARGDYYRWMCFCVYTLMPAYRAWFYPHEPAGEAGIDAVKERARVQLEAAWQQVADHLQDTQGPYMLGAQVSAVDSMLTMLMRWSRGMPRPSDAWPALAGHARRMKARPAFAEVYRREGIHDWT
ncbi:glutathione S-transferase family protein [Stenotrophomonas mori]|uniref:Glutathione S-transferase family protein n=1 Tax=Stenotrophomonas mori TaxID=2871096 RepID=A0ABT0SES3_9GAMM|nr:glutathione S-transferase family protein [Stenotrophomonas mori]